MDTGYSSCSSEALRVNLDRTRVLDLRLPASQQWLLDEAATKLGVHGRLESFFQELHHPYPNAKVIVEQYRSIVLGDHWHYRRCVDPGRAMEILADTAKIIFDLGLDAQIVERLARTLFDFMAILLEDDPSFEKSVDSTLSFLQRVLPLDESVHVRASAFLKTDAEPLARTETYSARARDLLEGALAASARFWKRSTDLPGWYTTLGESLAGDYPPGETSTDERYFERLEASIGTAGSWDRLVDVVDSGQIVDRLRHQLDDVDAPLLRTLYILHLLGLDGMKATSQHLLWDLNQVFGSLWESQEVDDLGVFVERAFSAFEGMNREDRGASLNCILTLGKVIYGSEDVETIKLFQDHLIDFGSIPPSIFGIDDNWQVEFDPNHLKSVRVWLELIGLDPAGSTKLISALIVNIKLCGIFISDTDLFQKDVTKLLNAEILPCYKLIHQLARLFPVYFDEIGAEGELREATTRIDEVCFREDALIHFLRKQIHTESNSTHLELVDWIAEFWHGGSLTPLRGTLPQDVLDSIETSGRHVDGVRKVLRAACIRLDVTPDEFLDLDAALVEEAVAGVEGVEDVDRQRVRHLARLHVLLHQKYSLDATGILHHLGRLRQHCSAIGREDLDGIDGIQETDDPEGSLRFVFDLMGRLREVILDPHPSKGHEDIYRKRHIAAGIPSMYGRYMEPKYSALGVMYRLESLANTLMARLVEESHIEYLSSRGLRRTVGILELFREGLEIIGITNEDFNSHLSMLRYSFSTTGFSLAQFVNIFQFMGRNVKRIIEDYFLRYHDDTLRRVITQRIARVTGAVHDQVLEHEIHRTSEEFYRSVISSAFLIQDLDCFIARVLTTLQTSCERLSPGIVRSVMSFETEKLVCPLDVPLPELDDQVFLGSKGYYLKKLHSIGFPVPPGYILTTELFRHREAIEAYPELRSEIAPIISEHVRRIEDITGKRYGDPSNILLLSVRSGATMSMPGAMNTFLNVGMNDELVEALSRQPNFGWTSWDCYRRFLQLWGMAHGISRDEFDEVILRFKRRYDVAEKVEFGPGQMRAIARAYKQLLHERNVPVEEDPHEQLLQAIFLVLRSWDAPRARIYRKRLQLAEEWGTAVIVQAMVLGNIGYDSGTGAVFTDDPMIKEPGINLYGDFTTTSQGEDVVAGLVHPLSISVRQQQRSFPDDGVCLERDFAEIYDELLSRANDLVNERGFGHQEIEFTFESDRREDLYILQTREHQTRARVEQLVFRMEDMESSRLGQGIGVGGGALNGIAVFDIADLERFSRECPCVNRILIRPDTVPDDIDMVFECEGLITARGGATSHAAVTASRLGKTCVVNCKMIRVDEIEKICALGGELIRSGDELAIDGRLGIIYRGHHPIGTSSIMARD